MLKIEIDDTTSTTMLRAIRAACNQLLGEAHADLTTQAAQHNSRAEELRVASERELDKSAACLTAHIAERQTAASPALAAPYGQGGPVDSSQFYRVGEQPSEQTVLAAAFDKAVQTVGPEIVAAALSTETDSSGTEWNPELHASTKAKNQDGTWKKRRGAAQVAEFSLPPGGQVPPSVPDAPPPLPPAAPTAEPIMPKIFALITSQIVTINQAVEAAQAEGFADLGTNGLGGAPREAQEAVLRKLESA